MWPRRFLEELRLVPPLEREDGTLDRTDISSFRSVFESLLAFGHTRGYHLFSLDSYRNALKKALKQHPRGDEFLKLFDTQEFDRRLKAVYESGMTETFVYACLVYALEDKTHEGLVFYDVRHDFKMKYDAMALVRGRTFVVNLFRGPAAARGRTEQLRDAAEREAKRNTMDSAHWDNLERKRISFITMSCDDDVFDVNGVRLPGFNSVNAVLQEIYDGADIEPEKRFYYKDNHFASGSPQRFAPKCATKS